MKKYLLLICIALSLRAESQVCLGNTDYSTVVFFDPAWLYGCSTGSSCSGAPTALSNLAACEPVQALEACAPAPSGCGTAQKGSDLWFRFFALADTALISVIQNTSFVASIQAFSGNPVCDSLVQIGCATASGPSSGVKLYLNGLNVNEIYWFRVFGTATNVSQRTGNFCFCGSVGLSNTTLGNLFSYFTARSQEGIVSLRWETGNAPTQYFTIEKSTDAQSFESIGRVEPEAGSLTQAFRFDDQYPRAGFNYYRIRAVDASGASEVSSTQVVHIGDEPGYRILQNPISDVLRVFAANAFTGEVISVSGVILSTWNLLPGDNEIDATTWIPGCYFFRNSATGDMQKFIVMR